MHWLKVCSLLQQFSAVFPTFCHNQWFGRTNFHSSYVIMHEVNGGSLYSALASFHTFQLMQRLTAAPIEEAPWQQRRLTHGKLFCFFATPCKGYYGRAGLFWSQKKEHSGGGLVNEEKQNWPDSSSLCVRARWQPILLVSHLLCLFHRRDTIKMHLLLSADMLFSSFFPSPLSGLWQILEYNLSTSPCPSQRRLLFFLYPRATHRWRHAHISEAVTLNGINIWW